LLKVLVIGSGAREHTIVWKLGQSPRVAEIYVAPGNAGTSFIATNLNIRANDLEAMARSARESNIDLVVVGPEVPLASGIVDLFHSRDIPIFGPTKEATRIESSKVFAKELMQKYGIPTARSATFASFTEAKGYVKSMSSPIVVKADGLAAGKGAIVAGSAAEAIEALSDIMEKRIFSEAGNRVLIEECLSGKEVSLLAFTDGKAVVSMVPACDYKRVGDGDSGPNTGGMGSYSPPGFFGRDMISRVKDMILLPAVRAMANEGVPYQGVLYAGLMMTQDGPKVIEFNARFGDPETQALLPLLESDLAEVMLAVIEGRLDKAKIKWSKKACVGVVMASGGYPGSYKTGFPITGLNDVDEDIMVFHAGTKMADGAVVTDGGRVLTVAARGRTIAEARERVYSNISRIHFEGCHYRKDIAAREVPA
jgi:phosphoribosylamine--glycine ligase